MMPLYRIKEENKIHSEPHWKAMFAAAVSNVKFFSLNTIQAKLFTYLFLKYAVL